MVRREGDGCLLEREDHRHVVFLKSTNGNKINRDSSCWSMETVPKSPGNNLPVNHKFNFDITNSESRQDATISRFHGYSTSNVICMEKVTIMEYMIGAR